MKLLLQSLLLGALVLPPTPISAQQPSAPQSSTTQSSAPGQEKNQTATTAKRSEALPAQTIPMEELLPTSTLSFVVTTSLSSLVENFRRLEASRVLEARLPKAERESAENPLEQAARLLSAGIKENSVLDETRIGMATIRPDFLGEKEKPTTVPNTPEGLRRVDDAAANDPDHDQLLDANLRPPSWSVMFVEAARPEQAKKAREQFIAYYSEIMTDLGLPAEAKPVKDPKFKGASVERLKNGYLGTMIGTTYLFGDQGAIEKILQLRHSTDAARLSDDLEFAQARGQLATSAGLFAYLNGRMLDAYIEPATKLVSGMLGPVFSSLFGPGAIKSVAFASSFERGGVVDRVVFSLDPAKRNLLTTFFSGPALDFRATNYVPAGTQILVSHSLDFTRLYDDFIVPVAFGSMAEAEAWKLAQQEVAARQEQKDDAGKKEDAENKEYSNAYEVALIKAREQTHKPEFINGLISRYEKEIGFKFRDEIVKDLGQEITVAWEIPKAPAELEAKRQTHIAAFIGIKDRAATRVALNKLIAYAFGAMSGASEGNDSPDRTVLSGAEPITDDGDQQSPPPPVARRVKEKEKTDEELKKQQEQRAAFVTMLPRENYKKAEIVNVQAFAFGLLDDYLVIADSAETIKRMIDTPENGGSITRDANFSTAMSGAPGALGTQVYVTPKYFDELLAGFVRSWSARPPENADTPPLNISATIAASAQATDKGLRIEAYSPIGIPGLIAFSLFADQAKSRADEHEREAAAWLKALAIEQKKFAAKNKGRYAVLDALIKFQKENPVQKVTNEKMEQEQVRESLYNRDLSGLKSGKQTYKFELKLKPGNKGFEVTATPMKYGRNSRQSFFIDESGKLHSANKNGEPASASDPQADERNDDDREK